MVESRPEDALVKLIKTDVETEYEEKSISHLLTEGIKSMSNSSKAWWQSLTMILTRIINCDCDLKRGLSSL